MHFSPFVSEKILATVWGEWRRNFPPLFLLKENCSQFCGSWQRQDSEIPVPGEKGWLSFRILTPVSPYQLELSSSSCLCFHFTGSQDAVLKKVALTLAR